MNRKFSNYKNRKIPVETYQPNSREEYLVWKVARYVGDKDMRPLLKVLRTHGYSIIEAAFKEFRNLEDVVLFTNKPGFFMHLIKKQLKKDGVNNYK